MEWEKRPYVYHLMAIVAVLIWGTTFVSTKVLLGYGLTPAAILLYRFMLAYVAIWSICPRKLFARTWRDELLFVGLGLCGGSLYFVTENTALGITLASNVSLLVSTAPLFTAFLAYAFIKGQQLEARLIAGSLLALVGVALVVFNGSFILKISPLGDLLTIAAALSWAFYGLILKKLDNRYPVLFITRKVFFYGMATLAPVFLVQPLQLDLEVLLLPVVVANLLFLGLIASMFCFIIWNVSVKHLGVVRTTNYVYGIPLTTMLTSALVIDERITTIGMLGSAFILSGVYLAERGFTLWTRSTIAK